MTRVAAAHLEQVLAIWQEVLGCARGELAPDSNFFLSGGDSLQLTRVLVRVGERLGVELDPRDVARFSTPGKMARCCVAAARQPSSCATAPVSCHTAAPDRDRFPCSEGQSALWLAEQVSGVALYNTAVVVHLTGDLQVPVLARALTLCLRQHEVLRTRLEFDTHQQKLMAVVAPALEIVLKVDCMPSEAVSAYFRARAARAFDFASGPLWRFELVQTARRTWSLLLCVHHCITDGWSGRVLLRHWVETYSALLGRPGWRPAGIEREFREFCRQQGEVSDAGLCWWRERLLGADRLAGWPVTGASRWPFAMASEEFALSGDLSRVQSAGITPAALALAALRLALWDVAGLDELCIGMPASARTSSAQEEGIGYFVNLLVLRDRIDAGDSGLALVHNMQRSLAGALAHRAIPFPVLARQLKPSPLPSGNLWCDVLFAFQNLPLATLQPTGLHMDVEVLTTPHGQHPLKVEFVQSGMAWRCRIEYARAILSQTDVRALCSALQRRAAELPVVGASSS